MSITEHPKINEWLTLVENEMRVTLAKQLASAVLGVAQFREGSIDSAKYLEWVDQYQVGLGNFVPYQLTMIQVSG